MLENTFCVGNLIPGIHKKSSFCLSLQFKRRGCSHTGKCRYRDTKQLHDHSPSSSKLGNYVVPRLLLLLKCVFSSCLPSPWLFYHRSSCTTVSLQAFPNYLKDNGRLVSNFSHRRWQDLPLTKLCSDRKRVIKINISVYTEFWRKEDCLSVSTIPTIETSVAVARIHKNLSWLD